MKDYFKSNFWKYFFIFLIVISSSFFAFYNLGASSLENWDEGIYANITAEMGSLPKLSMTYLNNVWLEKPFFGFWLHSLGVNLFGLNNFGLRFMSSLSFVGSVMLLFLILRKFYSNLLSFVISLAFLVCPLLYHQHFIRTADLDMYFLFFNLLSFYFYIISWKKTSVIWLSGLAAGLAFMARGYIALLIVLVIFLHWLIFKKNENKKLYIQKFIGMFSIITLPWHLYAFFLQKNEFIKSYLDYHFWERITTPLEGHVGGALYYYNYAYSKLSIFLWILLIAVVYVSIKSFIHRRKETIFWSLWFWVYLSSIQFVETKLTWYIIGLIPALFFILAEFFNDIFNKFKNSKIAISISAILFIFYFSIFFINSFNYVWLPTILPVNSLESYLIKRIQRPNIILIYSRLETFESSAAQFEWIKINKYRVIWIKNASDFNKYSSNNFVLLTDDWSYQQLKSYLHDRSSYSIATLNYYKNGWGQDGVPVVIDSFK